MVDLNKLGLMYFQSNKPVKYILKNSFDKKGLLNDVGYEIEISPIKVVDWAIFSNCLEIFVHELQDFGSLDILKMSYLEFIFKVLFNSELKEDSSYKFNNIFKLSMGLDELGKSMYKGKPCINVMKNNENVALITAKEFDDIKKIILFQNIYDYDDSYISPDIKRELEEYNNMNDQDIISPTFEDRKVFVMIKVGIDEDSINKMYYRTFSKMFDMSRDNDIYFVNKIMEASPKFDIKSNATYPIYAKKEDAMSHAFVSSEKLKTKIK